MSRMQVTSCDGCNETAPIDYSRLTPSDSWIHILAHDGYYEELDDSSYVQLDACSWACLATVVAARIAQGVS